MQVINIIVSDNKTPIVSVDSFGVLGNGENDSASIEAAEDFYVEKCKELMFGEGFLHTTITDNYGDEVNESIDNGYIVIGEHTVSLVWSSIDNIQM